MDLDELIAKIDALIVKLNEALAKELEVLALSAIATVTIRIQELGKDSQGSVFSDYTEQYKKRKQKIGRYRGFVDFTVTGDMFDSIGIIEQKSDGGDFVVTVGGRDEHTKNKMKGQEGYRPNWLSLSKEELDVLVAESNGRLQTAANDIFES